MATAFRRLGQSELLPRYIFAESLFARRRVLEVGAVASTRGESAKFLLDRGARAVVACDSDAAAVEEAQARFNDPNLRYRADVFDDLPSGGFDLVLVSDLGPYVRAPELLKELARLVAPRGYLLGGLRNPSGMTLAQVMDPEGREPPPTFGQLLDTLSPHFAFVASANQVPVLGYQLYFEQVSGPRVDRSLAEANEAAYYVVIAGSERLSEFNPRLVQLPPEPLAFTGGRLEEYGSRARSWQERSERLKEALAKVRAELERTQEDARASTQALEQAREDIARLTAQLELRRAVPARERESDELAARIRRLEAELQLVRERATDAEGRNEKLRGELELETRAQKEAAAHALGAQEATRLERSRREELAVQLEEARARLATAYEELASAQKTIGETRIELERSRLDHDRASQAVSDKERELESAARREVALAEQHSTAVAAVEHLRRELGQAQEHERALSAELEAKNAEVVHALRIGQADAAALTQAREELSALRAELEQTAERTRVQVAALDTELAAASSAAARAQQEAGALTTSRDSLRELAAQLEAKVAVASSELETARAGLERARAEAHQLRSQLAAVQAGTQGELAEEKAARQAAEKSVLTSEARVRELSDDREALLERVRDLETSLGDFQKLHQVREAELAQVATARDDLAAELKLRAHEGARQAQQLEEAERLSSEYQTARDELARSLDGTQAELQRQRSELEAARATADQRQAELEAARTTADQRQAELEAALAVADKSRAELEASRDAEALARQRRDESEAAVRASAEREGQALAELAASQGERATLHVEHQRLRAELEELRGSAAKHTQTDAVWRERFAALEQEAEARLARVQEVEKALAEANDGARSASAEAERVRVMLEASSVELANERRRVEASTEAAAAEHERLRAELEAQQTQREVSAEEAGRLGDELQAQLEAVKLAARERDATQAELANERERAASLERRNAELLEKLSVLEGAVAKHEAELRAHRTDKLVAEEELNEQRTEVVNMRAQLQDATLRITQVDDERASTTEQLRLLQAQLEEQIAQLHVSRGELEASGEQRRWLEEERARLAAALEDTTARSASITDERAALSAELERAEALRAGLADERARLAHELEQNGVARAALAEERDRLSAEVVQHRAARAALEQQLSDAHSGATVALARSEELSRRVVAQESELASLRRAVARSAAPVEQIFERASADLSAAKAELLQRRPPGSPGATAPRPTAGTSAPPGAPPVPGAPTTKGSLPSAGRPEPLERTAQVGRGPPSTVGGPAAPREASSRAGAGGAKGKTPEVPVQPSRAGGSTLAPEQRTRPGSTLPDEIELEVEDLDTPLEIDDQDDVPTVAGPPPKRKM